VTRLTSRPFVRSYSDALPCCYDDMAFAQDTYSQVGVLIMSFSCYGLSFFSGVYTNASRALGRGELI
jgi:hypothetical protein